MDGEYKFTEEELICLDILFSFLLVSVIQDESSKRVGLIYCDELYFDYKSFKDYANILKRYFKADKQELEDEVIESVYDDFEPNGHTI